MKRGSVWERIPALAVRTLLEELLAARARSFEDDTAALPVVTLLTRSGHAITGQLLAYDPQTHDVVVEELATARVTADLTYLNASEISAVRVQRALDRVDVITRGEVELPPQTEVPALLEVRRESAARIAALSERAGRPLALVVDWARFAEDAPRRHALRLLLESFERVVTALLAGFGGSALGEVERIVVQDGEAVDATVDGTAIVLRADLGRGRLGRLTDRRLEEALERAL